MQAAMQTSHLELQEPQPSSAGAYVSFPSCFFLAISDPNADIMSAA